MFPAFKQPNRYQDDDATAQNQQQDRQPDLAAEHQTLACHRYSRPCEKKYQQHECENDQAGCLGIIPRDDKFAMNGVFIV